ncbi:ETN8 [Scenedesmus sp. PABB004]|nr:ETN8 [Scenedesmus sp. PABB004]
MRAPGSPAAASPRWLTVAPSRKDRHTGLAYACYFTLGSGVLAPWNAFITAADYYEAVFPGRHVDRLFTVTYLPICLALLGVMIRWSGLPLRPRILTAFAGFTAVMLVVPLVDGVLVGTEGVGPPAALGVLLACVAAVGVLDGLSQGAVYADAAQLPPRYTHVRAAAGSAPARGGEGGAGGARPAPRAPRARRPRRPRRSARAQAVVGGTASSGVLICLLRIATKASLPATRAGLRRSTALYFAAAGCISAVCWVIFHSVLPRLGVVRHFRAAAAGEKLVELSPQPSLRHDEPPVALEVATADDQSSVLGSWYPILLITAFNVADLAGKNVPLFGLPLRAAARPGVLLAAAAARAAFVPAFLFAGRNASSAVGIMTALTVCLGLSNGFMTALLMVAAPASVESDEAGLVEGVMCEPEARRGLALVPTDGDGSACPSTVGSGRCSPASSGPCSPAGGGRSVPVEALAEALSCGLCSGPVASSLVLSCSHIFCGACLATFLQTRPACPTCSMELRGLPVRCLAIDKVAAAMLPALDPDARDAHARRQRDGAGAADKVNKMFWHLAPPPLPPAGGAAAGAPGGLDFGGGLAALDGGALGGAPHPGALGGGLHGRHGAPAGGHFGGLLPPLGGGMHAGAAPSAQMLHLAMAAQQMAQAQQLAQAQQMAHMQQMAHVAQQLGGVGLGPACRQAPQPDGGLAQAAFMAGLGVSAPLVGPGHQDLQQLSTVMSLCQVTTLPAAAFAPQQHKMHAPGSPAAGAASPPCWRLTVAPPLTVAPSLKDRHTGLAYACYFTLGSGVLASWNAFITAADYYEAVFPGRHVDRLFTVTYLPICLVVLGAMVRWNGLPLRPRILTAFAGFTAVMLVVPLVDGVLVGTEGVGPPAALGVLLACVAAIGVLDGLSQGAVYADAAQLPPRYTHVRAAAGSAPARGGEGGAGGARPAPRAPRARRPRRPRRSARAQAVVGGTASSGVLICLLRIATKASRPATRAGLRHSTALYFAAAGCISAVCWVIFHSVLPRLGVVRHFRAAAAAPAGGLGPGLSGGGVAPRAALDWRRVVAKAWRLAAAMVLVYVVTLSIFPGVLAEDTRSSVLGSWYPILLITAFNVADLAGKNVPLFGLPLRAAARPGVLLAAAAARAAFVPAFLFAGRNASSAVGIMTALTVCLGLTNGFMTALLLVAAHASVESDEAGLVEAVMVFALVLGLTLGAAAGFLWLL